MALFEGHLYLILVLSSDDFELVADSGEEDNSNKNDLKDFKDDKEKDVAGSKEEDSVSKAEEQKGDKLEGDVVMMEENSQGNEKEGKLNDNGEKNSNGGNKEKKKTIDEELKELTEKEGDGAGLGFRIKTYEEILREKALRKMLERRQQLQKEKEVAGTAEPEKADTKEVAKGNVEKQGRSSDLGLDFPNRKNRLRFVLLTSSHVTIYLGKFVQKYFLH